MSGTRVSDNSTHLYESTVDGELAEFTEYRRQPQQIAFIHTEIDEARRRGKFGLTATTGGP